MMILLVKIFVLLAICKNSYESGPVYAPGGAPQSSDTKSTDTKSTDRTKFAPRTLKNSSNKFVTETVYGFMDFTTTVGSTVMVFTPQSKADNSPISKSSNIKSSVTATETTTHLLNPDKPEELVPATSSIPATGLAKLLKESRLDNREKETGKRGKNGDSKSPAFDLSDNVLGTNEDSLPLNNELSHKINKKYNFDYLSLEPSPIISDDYSETDIHSKNPEKPTGLVTTLGGTIISNGHTTIHKTSVIGTYVGNKYAQILESTSKIFKDNKISQTTPVETIKAVIEGSATQFIKPEVTATTVFATPVKNRTPRYEIDPAFTKRAEPSAPAKYDYYYDVKDQNYEDEYDDLIRAGSGVHPSFIAYGPQDSFAATPVINKNEQSTYRPRSKNGGTRNIPPSFLRNTPPDQFRNSNRFQTQVVRSKLSNNKKLPQQQVSNNESPKFQRPQSSPLKTKKSTEETVSISSSVPIDGPTNVWLEIKTLRSLHEFRVGTAKNTRYVTYTKTLTHTIEPTSIYEEADSKNSEVYVEKPLFENVLRDENLEVATLPPINIEGKDINDILSTTTQTFRTTETMYKTSVLPVKNKLDTQYYTLTQTYLITRVVSAIKTVLPVDAFEFVPSNSLNEFNDKLLAEGTENEAALLPGEQETIENKGIRVAPPSDLLFDPNLSSLAGGKFNPEALEKQSSGQSAPNLAGSQQSAPNPLSTATPALSPEALQLAYLRLMNPYLFGGFPGAQQTTVTSSPVVITTDVVTTSTQVLRVIFNARPIMKTISNTGTVRTTITTYSTTTVTAQPSLPFPFPQPFPHIGG